MGTHLSYRVSSGLSDWARKVLSMPTDAVLCTVNADGSPHSVPVGFCLDGERLLVPTGATTRKVRNVEARGWARVLVMAPAATTGIDDGWVAADGPARAVGGQEANELNARALDRYLTEEGKLAYSEVFMPIMDATIVVDPERWQTWDESGMLETALEHGYTEEQIARWYVAR